MAVRYALVLDTETTGLDPAQGARCIEVAVCLYDLKRASPVASYASLIHGIALNGAEAINRIPAEMLPEAPEDAWYGVSKLALKADVIVAHRAEFDQKFVPYVDTMAGLPWACTKTDFDWPGVGRGDHLVHLALAYGCGVVHAHRAMTDVDIICRVLTRVAELGHSLPDLFAQAMRPKKKFVALVSFDQRQLAKDAGFSWAPESKEWWRMMPPEDAQALPFRVAQRGA